MFLEKYPVKAKLLKILHKKDPAYYKGELARQVDNNINNI